MNRQFAKLIIPEVAADSKLIMGDGTNLFEIVPIESCTVELKYDHIPMMHITEMSIELLDGAEIECLVDVGPLAKLLRKCGYSVEKDPECE